MKLTLQILFCSVLILSSFVLNAQDDDSFLNGILLDYQTKEPVVFATVRLKGKALGVISNNDGGFKIPVDFLSLSDTLVISSMGYQTKNVDFALLKENNINQILLTPFTFELQETVVTAKKRRRLTKVKTNPTAKQIIKSAIERIPVNYDTKPFELVGYYRDYQLRDKVFLNLNEALVKVYDKGFDVNDYTSLQFGLYNYKANLNFEIDSLAAKPYNYNSKDKYIPNVKFTNTIVPNELVLLFNHDAIRHHNELSYSFVDVFVKHFIRNHDFITHFLTNYGNKKVYKIKFEKTLPKFQVKGDIYIDVDTYAIRKLAYNVYQQRLEGPPGMNYNESETELLYEILVEYKENVNHMFLNYISFHNKFKLVKPPKFYIKEIIRKFDTQEMLIVLNKPAKNWRSLRPNNINLYYGKNSLKVEGLSQKDNTTYKLEFSRKTKAQRKKIREFYKEIGTKNEKAISFSIRNLKDFENNIIGEEDSEVLDQYREFFTQRIVTDRNTEVENISFVNKTISLDHPDQLKIKMKDNEEFWMNTPLKKNKD